MYLPEPILLGNTGIVTTEVVCHLVYEIDALGAATCTMRNNLVVVEPGVIGMVGLNGAVQIIAGLRSHSDGLELVATAFWGKEKGGKSQGRAKQ